MNQRTLLAAISGACLAGALGACGATAGGPSAAPTSSYSERPSITVTLRTVSQPGCVSYTLLSAYSIAPDGRLIAAIVRAPRTITGLITGDGIAIDALIPDGGGRTSAAFVPDGYLPARATRASRQRYGIPDRPAGKAAAADWDRDYARPLRSVPSLGCSLLTAYNGPAVPVASR